jgi:hypothetical protein
MCVLNRVSMGLCQALTIQVEDEDGRPIKTSCPIYYFGAQPPRPEIIKKAKSVGVTLKHFTVMPLLLDDLCDASRFYAPGRQHKKIQL